MKRCLGVSVFLLLLLTVLAGTAFAAGETLLPFDIEIETTLGEDYLEYYFVVPKGEPQMVKIDFTANKKYQKNAYIEMRSYAYEWDDDDNQIIVSDSGSDIDSVLTGKVKGANVVFSQTFCLYPGTYYLWAEKNDDDKPDIPLKIKATKSPVPNKSGISADLEPNGKPEEAIQAALGTAFSGLLASGDTDFFKLRLDGDGKYSFSFTQYEGALGFELYRLKKGANLTNYKLLSDRGNIYGAILEQIYYRNTPSKFTKKATFKKTIELPDDGEYYVKIINHGKNAYSHYDMLIERKGAAVTKLSLPGTMNLAENVSAPLQFRMTPYYFPTKEIVTFTSSNESVCTVAVNDAGKPVVTGVKAGTAKITVTSVENSKRKATCTVTVKKDNKFTRSKPITGTGKAVFASTKSMQYKDGKLVCDIFVYNKTKYKLHEVYGVNLALFYMNLNDYGNIDWDEVFSVNPPMLVEDLYGDYDDEDDEYVTETNVKMFSPIKPGKYGIVTWTIDLAKYPKLANLNLASGEYNAVLLYDPESEDGGVHTWLRYGKSLKNSKNPKLSIVPIASGKGIKGALEDLRAVPEAAYAAKALQK